MGTMTFGTEWGWGADKATSKEIFDQFAEQGGNFIDTANFYTQGTSERYLSEFTSGDRDRFVLATKFSLNMRPDDPNAGGNHRKSIVRSLEDSLKRLNTDYIDLYWLHAWDFTTYPEEVMRALDDMVRAGKVLYIGVSDTPAWIVARSNTLAELRGWTPFVGLQIEYSLIERTPERELLPMAEAYGMTTLAWSPLGAGILTGKYNDQKPSQNGESRLKEESSHYNERNLAIAKEVSAVAQEIGVKPSQVAIAWLLHQRNVIPILGARRTDQLNQNLEAMNVQLSQPQLDRLNQISSVTAGFPHDFLSRDTIRKILLGESKDSIEAVNRG